MYSETGMGPFASISRASRSAARPGSGNTLGAGDRLHAPAAALGRGDEVEAPGDHRQRQPLAHVKVGRLGEMAELVVGLAVEFDEDAAEAVAGEEQADELARLVARVGLPERPGEDREKDDAFEDRLVDLARVARVRPAGGEDDTPRHGGRPPPQFAVHEIGEAPEEQAEGGAAGDVIVDAQPIEAVLAGEIEDAERGA